MVYDPLRVWKENHSITVFQCYFRINKGHDHILLVYNKVIEVTWKDILCYPKRGLHCGDRFRIIFKYISFCKIPWSLTLDVPHTKTLYFGLWVTRYLDRGTYTILSSKLHLDPFCRQTSRNIFFCVIKWKHMKRFLGHQMKTHEKISTYLQPWELYVSTKMCTL